MSNPMKPNKPAVIIGNLPGVDPSALPAAARPTAPELDPPIGWAILAPLAPSTAKAMGALQRQQAEATAGAVDEKIVWASVGLDFKLGEIPYSILHYPRQAMVQRRGLAFIAQRLDVAYWPEGSYLTVQTSPTPGSTRMTVMIPRPRGTHMKITRRSGLVLFDTEVGDAKHSESAGVETTPAGTGEGPETRQPPDSTT